jgi:hypothetical protein
MVDGSAERGRLVRRVDRQRPAVVGAEHDHDVGRVLLNAPGSGPAAGAEDLLDVTGRRLRPGSLTRVCA